MYVGQYNKNIYRQYRGSIWQTGHIYNIYIQYRWYVGHTGHIYLTYIDSKEGNQTFLIHLSSFFPQQSKQLTRLKILNLGPTRTFCHKTMFVCICNIFTLIISICSLAHKCKFDIQKFVNLYNKNYSYDNILKAELDNCKHTFLRIISVLKKFLH